MYVLVMATMEDNDNPGMVYALFCSDDYVKLEQKMIEINSAVRDIHNQKISVAKKLAMFKKLMVKTIPGWDESNVRKYIEPSSMNIGIVTSRILE